jgi:hypothetical protein
MEVVGLKVDLCHYLRFFLNRGVLKELGARSPKTPMVLHKLFGAQNEGKCW